MGLGHIKRGISLAEGLKEQLECEIIFVFQENHLVKELLEENRFNCLALNKEFSQSKMLELCTKKDVFITDSPIMTSSYLKKAQTKVGFLVNIYYGGKKRLIYPGKILIDPNVFKSKPAIVAGVKYFGGGKYVILSRKFIAFSEKKKNIARNVRNVLICFGGSDPNNLTARMVAVLKREDYRKLNIIVVVGSGYPKYKHLEKEVCNTKNIVLRAALPDLAGLMKAADIAVLSGGILMHEAGVMGIPSIIICHNSEQDIEARAFQKQRMAINLGLHYEVSDETIIGVLNGLIMDRKIRQRLSNNSRKHIDAFGVNRIVKIISKQFYNMGGQK